MSGCIPAPPPPPGILGRDLLILIVVIGIIVVGITILKGNFFEMSDKKEISNETIMEKLENLEKRIKNIEKKVN